ncbi:hypothetical protein PAHAL_9G210400 [Panicum hallii]|uniref:Uncharacterized protein n=1 Tax=Panicum hallii TaxID=206008 RepID=A0A2T8I206_9POAL|nr:hypothetical protein PAHAL_9G210400 [Panicum hallii]
MPRVTADQLCLSSAATTMETKNLAFRGGAIVFHSCAAPCGCCVWPVHKQRP